MNNKKVIIVVFPRLATFIPSKPLFLIICVLAKMAVKIVYVSSGKKVFPRSHELLLAT